MLNQRTPSVARPEISKIGEKTVLKIVQSWAIDFQLFLSVIESYKSLPTENIKKNEEKNIYNCSQFFLSNFEADHSYIYIYIYI